MTEVTTDTHSAAWHYEQSEAYMHMVAHDVAGPDRRQLWATMALAHAQLATVGAAVLGHGRARQDLVQHAEGLGTRGAT